jgi:3',5'-cyclic AMP phosphodiesterase CpdA
MESAINNHSNPFGNPTTPSTAETTVTLAHFSDPHVSCMEDITARDLVSKRLFGYLRWKLHRGAEHGHGVLSALHTDLIQTNPDQIAVTGDLTHLGLSSEYKKALIWLQSLGSPYRVTVIPGNHDTYVKLIWHQTMAHWTDYMISDTPRAENLKPVDTESIFPSLRIRSCIAIIGVCTARPSAPHLATGSIGAGQLQQLETVLAQTARKRLFRILLIHHPPTSGTVSWRKRLTDAPALRSVLDRQGAELILHGHAHRTLQNSLPSPNGNIPVIGVPSISALGRTPERRARYYIYRITPVGNAWDVRVQIRIYSPEEDCFIRECEQSLKNFKMPKLH